MTDNGAKLTVTFTHPTHSEQTFRAAVTPESTADYLIQELVKANFMPPSAANEPYRLAFNGTEMTGSTTMQAAGVQEGALLQVHRSGNGALPSASVSGSCRA
jgi:hypothetical protein